MPRRQWGWEPTCRSCGSDWLTSRPTSISRMPICARPPAWMWAEAMLVHIVLVRGPEGMSAEDREEMAQALGSLAKVPGVKDMTWGPDVSARGKGYTHAAVMNFDD